MELILRTSPPLPMSDLRQFITNGGFTPHRNCCFFSNGYSSSSSLPFPPLQKLSPTILRTSVITTAKKNKKKLDGHSFVAKPDEATGPFPEAVLLRERIVQEDGRLLPEFADAEERELFESLNLRLESDLNEIQMRHYEVVYLIHEDYAKEVTSVISKIEDFLSEKKGRIWRFSDWGLRKLAYKIKKANNAHYILMNFELEAKWINDFKSLLDKDERVIRHLVIKRDEAITEDCPPPPEFHTLRAGLDEDDEDGEDEDEEDEDDEDEDEDEDEDGIIYVEDDEDEDEDAEDDKENKNHTTNSRSNEGRRTKAEKVGAR